MRAAFIKTLTEMAEADPRIVLLTGDLGFMALEPFAVAFPDRFINVGVAEQNMVGVATGLAEAGFVPFVYSIVTFAALRPYEFIRNGPILHQLPVRIIGMGGGFEYGSAGPTHHGLEDIGVMRVQPGIMTIAPADHEQVRTAMLRTRNHPGPIYFRLGKDDHTVVPGLDGRFDVGRAHVVREGRDVLIVAMGGVAAGAVQAADALGVQGVEATVMVTSCLNPCPVGDLTKAMSRHRLVLTVEAHYSVGGLASMVSEIIATSDLACKLHPLAVAETPDGVSGSRAHLHELHGLSPEAIVKSALSALAA